MVSFSSKAATGQDAGRLADIRVAAMKPSLEAVGRFDPHRARDRFLSGFNPSDTVILFLDGELAGFYAVRRKTDEFYLDHLYIRAEFQGRGIGREVISSLKDEARRASLPIRLMALKAPPTGFICHAALHSFRRTSLTTTMNGCRVMGGMTALGASAARVLRQAQDERMFA